MTKPEPDPAPRYVGVEIEVKLGPRTARYRRAAQARCCTWCGLVVADETKHLTACAVKKG